jgi:uncharacterized protein (TIGR04255 family)
MPFRYRNDPIVEAIVEFAPDGATLPSEGAERVLAAFADYTGRREDFRPVGAHFDMASGQITPLEATPRVRQWNQHGTRMVQFGADLCAFNALPPYTTFQDYVPDMNRLVTAYEQEVGAARTSFLGQRYLNRIAIPNEDPARYFTLFPHGEQADRRPRPFSIQMEIETLAFGGNLMLTLAYQGATGESHQYLLDLYARVGENPPIPFRWTDMSAWQQAAHEAIENAFEAPLTDRCREMLGREET